MYFFWLIHTHCTFAICHFSCHQFANCSHVNCVRDKTCFIQTAGFQILMFSAGKTPELSSGESVLKPDHFHFLFHRLTRLFNNRNRPLHRYTDNIYWLILLFQIMSMFRFCRMLVLYWLSLWKAFFNQFSPTVFLKSQLPPQTPWFHDSLNTVPMIKRHRRRLSIKFFCWKGY